jgi:glycosyltransferase involved in cell wall biosynthesis
MKVNESSRSILIISHNDSEGGAARAASRLNSCFISENISSKFLVAKKFSDLESVYSLNNFRKFLCKIFSRLDKYICRIIDPNNKEWKSAAYFGVIAARNINKSNFSVINLHWIGHGLISFRQLNKIKKPIIWTLHDEWILNPYSHYPSEQSRRINLIRRILSSQRLRVKFNFILKDNVYFVCVSETLATKLKNRFPDKVNNITTIPNPVDLSVFFPDKSEKGITEIISKKPYVLFLGGVNNSRKGWDLLQESIRFTTKRYALVIVGESEYTNLEKNLELISIKKVKKVEILRQLYSNATAVVVPSRAEQLPQVATESISCGTPVIAFDIDGLKDIVIMNQTGILVKPFDTKSFSKAIDSLIDIDKSIYLNSCRDFAEINFSFQVIANKYKNVIEQASSC